MISSSALLQEIQCSSYFVLLFISHARIILGRPLQHGLVLEK